MREDIPIFLLGGFGAHRPGEEPYYQLEIIDCSSVENWVIGGQKVAYLEPNLQHFKKGGLSKDGTQYFNLNIESKLYVCDLVQVLKRDRASGLTVAKYSLQNLRPHWRDVNAWFNYLIDTNAVSNASGLNVGLNGETKVNGSGVVSGIAPPKVDRLAELVK